MYYYREHFLESRSDEMLFLVFSDFLLWSEIGECSTHSLCSTTNVVSL